jgi:hypothetical protein
MLYSGVIKPTELAMMTRILDDYCQEHRMTAGSAARENMASRSRAYSASAAVGRSPTQ